MDLSKHPHNDQPVIDCELGREEFCLNIARQIIHANAPKTFAIHGTWGTGKTSLLMQLNQMLSGESPNKPDSQKSNLGKLPNKEFGDVRIKTVWFEAWQYQQEENIVLALLKEIRDQLSLPNKIWKEIKEAALVGTLSTLQSIDLEFKLFGSGIKFNNLGQHVSDNFKEYQRENLSMPLSSIQQKKMLKKAIDELLKLNWPGRDQKKDHKLVIFIDDLDRCEPEAAYRILESIKVYLNLDNCIFVFGMDQEAVERIISRHYEKLLNVKEGQEETKNLKKLSRLYIEKICQDIFHLPVMTKTQKETYFENLLGSSTGNVVIEYILKITKDFNLLPPFPRSIKILANIILFQLRKEKIYKKLETDFENANFDSFRLMLILCYLHSFHYEIYQLIYLYDGFFVKEFQQFCQEGRTKHKLLRNLILPASKEVDISDANPIIPNEDAKLVEPYPHTHLRQVLWIRDLVTFTAAVTDAEIDALRI